MAEGAEWIEVERLRAVAAELLAEWYDECSGTIHDRSTNPNASYQHLDEAADEWRRRLGLPSNWLEVRCDPAIVPGGCGGIALLVRRKEWRLGDEITTANLRWPDGSPTTPGEPARCHACNRQYGGNALPNIVTATVKRAGTLTP